MINFLSIFKSLKLIFHCLSYQFMVLNIVVTVCACQILSKRAYWRTFHLFAVKG